MRDNRTGTELATAAARRYLLFLAEDLHSEAEAVRRELPFGSWQEPLRTDAYAQFLYAIGEPGEALAEARACAAACGWDEYSSLQLAWAQGACNLDQEALETLDSICVSEAHAAWVDHFRFTLHLEACEYERASAFLIGKRQRWSGPELERRMHRWLNVACPSRAVRTSALGADPHRSPPPWEDVDALVDSERDAEPGWTVADMLVRVGEKVGQGDLDGALCDATLLTRVAPQFPQGWCMLGMVRAKSNKLEAAELAFDEALRLEPTYASPRLSRAIVRYRRRDFLRAAEDAKIVREYQPLNMKASVLHCKALVRCLHLKRAWKAFTGSFDAIEHESRVRDIGKEIRKRLGSGQLEG